MTERIVKAAEINKIDTILFDFDGTVVNTNDVIIASWQHTYKKYLGHEMPVERITSCFGEPLLITMEREFPDVAPEESAAEYRRFQQENAGRLVTLFPGIKELLEELRNRNYSMAIVTSRTRESLINYLNQFGIGEYFKEMVTCDDTDIHKPNPEPIYMALDRLNITKEQAIMIGDSFFDIKCAVNAGVRSVMVGWRVTAEENHLEGTAEPDVYIDEPMELLDILSK